MRLVIITTILIIFASCVPKQAPIDYENINIPEIMRLAESQKDKIHSLRGMARVKAKSRYDDLVINQVTLLKVPLKFRLEALAAFGQSIAVVTSDGNKVIFKTSNDQVAFPDVRNFNLSYFYPGIPTELKTEQLIELLLGKVPFGLWTEEYDISFDKSKQKFLVEYKNSNNTQTVLTVDPVSGYIENADINLNGKEILTISYTNFTKLDNLIFPKTINFKYLSYELSIKYSELNLNDKIEDSLFFQ